MDDLITFHMVTWLPCVSQQQLEFSGKASVWLNMEP